MFTNNFKSYMNLFFFYATYGAYEYFTDYEGNAVMGYRGSSYSAGMGGHLTTVQSSIGYAGVYFGKGTTPPTLNDRTMESVISSGLSKVNAAVMQEHEGSSHNIHCLYSLKNTSAEDITISEIGVFSWVNKNNTTTITSSEQRAYVLMFRTVLDDPVTIPPGVVKTINLKLDFTQSQ